jgi:TonB family protein
VAEEYEVGELPTLLNEVRIPYPPSAKAKGIQGAVIFDLLIGSDGFVKSAKTVQSPSKELSDAAGIAVKKFRFRPAKIGDKAVAIQIRYTYRFVLE